MRTRRAERLTYARSMSRVLLDTDILSEILKGKSPIVTAKAATYLAQQGCFTTSAVTVAEIVYGFTGLGEKTESHSSSPHWTQPRSCRWMT